MPTHGKRGVLECGRPQDVIAIAAQLINGDKAVADA
jgi:hypothetical protein